MSDTIDWEYSSKLSLMSISSYVEYETGNIYVNSPYQYENGQEKMVDISNDFICKTFFGQSFSSKDCAWTLVEIYNS